MQLIESGVVEEEISVCVCLMGEMRFDERCNHTLHASASQRRLVVHKESLHMIHLVIYFPFWMLS